VQLKTKLAKEAHNRRIVPISPHSVVRLVHYDRRTPLGRGQVGRVLRVGYYSRKDGSDCIWLVNDDGEYEQTTDHKLLYWYFDVILLTDDTNWYGRGRPPLPPIRKADTTKVKFKRWRKKPKRSLKTW
jgi:hypothetical protein